MPASGPPWCRAARMGHTCPYCRRWKSVAAGADRGPRRLSRSVSSPSSPRLGGAHPRDARRWLWNLDMPKIDYPLAVFANEALASGHLPLWNDRLGLGFPLYAEGQIAAFYPPSWLVFRLEPITALDVYRVLHLAWAGLGAGLLVLRLRGSRPGAVIAVLVAVLGGGIVAKLEWHNLVAAYAWLPWVLLPLIRRPRPTRAGLVVAGVVLRHPGARRPSQHVAAHRDHGAGSCCSPAATGSWPGLRRALGIGLLGAAIGAVAAHPDRPAHDPVRPQHRSRPTTCSLRQPRRSTSWRSGSRAPSRRSSTASWNIYTNWYPDGTFALLEVAAYVGLPGAGPCRGASRLRRSRPLLIAVGRPHRHPHRGGVPPRLPPVDPAPQRSPLPGSCLPPGEPAARGAGRAWRSGVALRSACGRAPSPSGSPSRSPPMRSSWASPCSRRTSSTPSRTRSPRSAAPRTSPQSTISHCRHAGSVAAPGRAGRRSRNGAPRDRRRPDHHGLGHRPHRRGRAGRSPPPPVRARAKRQRRAVLIHQQDSDFVRTLQAAGTAPDAHHQAARVVRRACPTSPPPPICRTCGCSPRSTCGRSMRSPRPPRKDEPGAAALRRALGVDVVATFDAPCPGTPLATIDHGQGRALPRRGCRATALLDPAGRGDSRPGDRVAAGPARGGAGRRSGAGHAVSLDVASRDDRASGQRWPRPPTAGSGSTGPGGPAGPRASTGSAVETLQALGGQLVPVPAGSHEVTQALVPWDALAGLAVGLVALLPRRRGRGAAASGHGSLNRTRPSRVVRASDVRRAGTWPAARQPLGSTTIVTSGVMPE